MLIGIEREQNKGHGPRRAAAGVRTFRHDADLTTEVAMVVTVLLGRLALNEPQVAAALAVVVTIILASRTKAHDWIAAQWLAPQRRRSRRSCSWRSSSDW